MIWDIKTVARKYEDYHMSAIVVVVTGIICFVLSLVSAIDVFFQLYDVFYFDFVFSIVSAVIVFYLCYEILILLAYFIIERFVRLFKIKP